MERRKLSKSTRKFVRLEKARIRREVLDLKEQERLVNELYQKISNNIKTKQSAEEKQKI